jgi:hypothetical protein
LKFKKKVDPPELPQKAEISQRPSNTIEKVNFEIQDNDIKFSYNTHTSDNDNNTIKQDNLMPPHSCYPPPLNSSIEAILEDLKPIPSPTSSNNYTVDSLYSINTSDEVLTKETIPDERNITLVEIMPDQSLLPLQINALQNEQLIPQQPIDNLEIKIDSLETYNDQIITLDNLASPDLFSFLSPISQRIIEPPLPSEIEMKTPKETPIRSYTFDEMVVSLVLVMTLMFTQVPSHI